MIDSNAKLRSIQMPFAGPDRKTAPDVVESDRYSGREDDPQVPRQLRQSRHRRPLPAPLPREIHRLEPEESCCPECGSELDYPGKSVLNSWNW